MIQISNPYSERITFVGADDKNAMEKSPANSTGAHGENDDKSNGYIAIICHL